MRTIHDEDPYIHWDNINVKNKIILDLGCGDFGRATSLNYLTTLEYFVMLEAKFVIGVDSNITDIKNLTNKNLSSDKCIIINESVDSSDKILNLIKKYNVDIVKSDIEGGEKFLFDICDNDFKNVKEYYIETHGDTLYKKCIDKLNQCEYLIYDQIDLAHTSGNSKVVFARKQ